MTDESWPRIAINPMLSTSKLNANDLDFALLDEMLTLLCLSIITESCMLERKREESFSLMLSGVLHAVRCEQTRSKAHVKRF